MNERQTVLLTGAAGFIGYHVSRALLERGDEVIGVDEFNDYYDLRLKERRWGLLEKYDSFQGYRLDVSREAALAELFQRHQPQKVCHLAAQAGVRYSLTNPHVYERSNVRGFLSILENCRHHGLPRLVYASSSSVYGGNTKLPFSESDRVDTPISLYAATKRANELMAHTYSHLYQLHTIGLRFFTVYGPWGRPDMAMWLFARAIMRNEPIKVYNHGDMQRDFTYIDDIVTGVLSCLDKPELPRNVVINLGNHRPEQLLDMIAAIEKACGREANKKLEPMQPGDVKATYADIDRAGKLLDFSPTTPIAIGVPRFVEWFLDHRDLTFDNL